MAMRPPFEACKYVDEYQSLKKLDYNNNLCMIQIVVKLMRKEIKFLCYKFLNDHYMIGGTTS